MLALTHPTNNQAHLLIGKTLSGKQSGLEEPIGDLGSSVGQLTDRPGALRVARDRILYGRLDVNSKKINISVKIPQYRRIS